MYGIIKLSYSGRGASGGERAAAGRRGSGLISHLLGDTRTVLILLSFPLSLSLFAYVFYHFLLLSLFLSFSPYLSTSMPAFVCLSIILLSHLLLSSLCLAPLISFSIAISFFLFYSSLRVCFHEVHH